MSTFTIWVVDLARVAIPDVNVYDARSVTHAMEQALEGVARKWEIDPLNLKILGVAKGDIRILDCDEKMTPLQRQ